MAAAADGVCAGSAPDVDPLDVMLDAVAAILPPAVSLIAHACKCAHTANCIALLSLATRAVLQHGSTCKPRVQRTAFTLVSIRTDFSTLDPLSYNFWCNHTAVTSHCGCVGYSRSGAARRTHNARQGNIRSFIVARTSVSALLRVNIHARRPGIFAFTPHD